MKKRTLLVISLMLLMAFSIVAVAGCGGGGEQAKKKGPVKLLYVQWACASAETHVMKAILEDKMG
ncbi:MAG TPA: glycine/betaine ABC transporter substrate-binding protein, partial [Syntrophomonas sp.]|nr:glycine/betaine ABC transporter substrate-binding protein [Syntrophomonas sp.]